MSSPDPKYAAYEQFFFFELKVASDYDTGKDHLTLESKIVHSTMHPSGIKPPSERPPSVKKFYRKLELYYGGKATPAVVMDLTPLVLRNSIGVPTPIHDGYVADSLEIKFKAADLEAFRTLKPTDAHVIIYDAEGKVVTSADVDVVAKP